MTTVKNLSDKFFKTNVELAQNLKISSINSPVCIQNILGKQIVFATLNEQDIVVENKEQLMIFIEQLCNNFNVINNSIKNIHTLSKKI